MSDSFEYIWAYEVVPEKLNDFIDLYAPDGAWGALFRRGSGYRGTQLLADQAQANRFLTIDRWESKDAFTLFRDEFADEFDHLDRLGEQLTSEEVLIGEFGSVPRQERDRSSETPRHS